MLTILISMLISMAFATYGVYRFTSNYTCLVTKQWDSAYSSCKYWMTIPSAILILCVMSVATYKGIMLNPI